MAKLYTATSLEEIAQLFDQRARIAAQQSFKTAVVKDASLYNREATIWETAAAILRDTDLKSPDALHPTQQPPHAGDA